MKAKELPTVSQNVPAATPSAAGDPPITFCQVSGIIARKTVVIAHCLCRSLGALLMRCPPCKSPGGGSAGEVTNRREQYLQMINRRIQSPLLTIEQQLDRIEKNLKGDGPSNSALMEDYFTRVNSSIKHLSTFVDDFVEVSRIEHGIQDCKPFPVKIQDLADEVIRDSKSRNERNVTLSHRVDASLAPVLCDARFLHRALVRLIASILQSAHEAGEIWIEAVPRNEGRQKLVLIAVCSTDCGINDEDLRMFLDVFRQGQRPFRTAGRHGSSEIGFYIAREVIEAHQSHAKAEALFGGIRVSFPLPFAKE